MCRNVTRTFPNREEVEMQTERKYRYKTLVDKPLRPSPFFSPFRVVRPTQIFGIFKKKKKKKKKEANDVLKPFYVA